jgi:tripartite-type tricarboxylate transporter receptor subunit TctC
MPPFRQLMAATLPSAGTKPENGSAAACATFVAVEGIGLMEGNAMKLLRRKFLHLAAAAAALPALPRVASALDYPTRPVRIIVGFAPGGGNDIVARVMAQWLQEHLGQPFVVENRPGAATNIATEAVVNATPDGYTLLLASLPNATNASLFGKLKFNYLRDIAPVAGIMRTPNLIVINPSVPAKTLTEFIAYAKAHPGKLNMASAGVGSGSHLAGELFMSAAGVDLLHVPYRGTGPAVTALLGGQADFLITAPTAPIEFLRAGRLRALAVTTAARLEQLPDVPPASQFVPGYEMSYWYGLSAPKGTPAEVIDKINKAINEALADPKIKDRLANLGGVAMPMTAGEFGAFVAADTAKWAKVIQTAHISPN